MAFGNGIQREREKRDEERSRGLGDVYKRQGPWTSNRIADSTQAFCGIESNDPSITLANHHNPDSTWREFSSA